ncbi:MAG: hypothetical protein OIF56_12500 [Cohaesibacter sp.]|nr:hypothetical protein [Cohaesibacter sp.]
MAGPVGGRRGERTTALLLGTDNTNGIKLPWTAQDGFERWLLFRRSLSKPGEIAYYFAYAQEGTSLARLAGAAGLRWTIEECFLRAKDDLGLF